MARPGQARPGQARPGQARPGQARPGPGPGLARPGQARPGQARPGQARPGQARPGQARPGQARPGQARLGLGLGVMGDFNDELFNRSITDYALALKDSSKVRSRRARRPLLFNLMWEIQEDGVGSHYYDEWAILDQMRVNRAMLEDKYGPLVPKSCGIFTATRDMLQAAKSKPRRFGRS